MQPSEAVVLIVLLILLFVGVCSSDEPDDGSAGGASASGGGEGGTGGDSSGEGGAGAHGNEGGSAGDGGAGGGAECTTAADCPGETTTCAWRICDSGRCTVGHAAEGTWVDGLALGDCLERRCNDFGGIITAADPSDVRDDGNECTVDACGSGGPENSPAPDGTPCSIGACSGGVCAATPTCSDGRQNGDEIGVDCGGSCDGCPDGTVCSEPADCAGGVCAAGLCACGVDHIVISEVMTRGTHGTATAGRYDEFVELFNPTSAPIASPALLVEATLPGSSAMVPLFGPQPVTLLPGQRFVIGGADFPEAADGSFAPDSQLVDNYGDITVRDGAGPIIDTLCYCRVDGCTVPPTTGRCEGSRAENGTSAISMARRPAGYECNDTNDNAMDFRTLSTPTPGI